MHTFKDKGLEVGEEPPPNELCRVPSGNSKKSSSLFPGPFPWLRGQDREKALRTRLQSLNCQLKLRSH